MIKEIDKSELNIKLLKTPFIIIDEFDNNLMVVKDFETKLYKLIGLNQEPRSYDIFGDEYKTIEELLDEQDPKFICDFSIKLFPISTKEE